MALPHEIWIIIIKLVSRNQSIENKTKMCDCTSTCNLLAKYRTKPGTTANEGTRGSLVRMTPDVVYYSWAAFDMSI